MKPNFILMNFLMLGCMISFWSCEKKIKDYWAEEETYMYFRNESSKDIVIKIEFDTLIAYGEWRTTTKEIDLKQNQTYLNSYKNDRFIFPENCHKIEITTEDFKFISSDSDNSTDSKYFIYNDFFKPLLPYKREETKENGWWVYYYKEIVFTDQVLEDLKNESNK